MEDLKKQFTSTTANQRPLLRSTWSERERWHWSVERRTRWVRVLGHGGEEVGGGKEMVMVCGGDEDR
ncbi:hypothetical protein H5410_062291 [Solanum commersonii]|uniref:Uncharacterized protein n=1 Tax=Solanum commersonii TaxID=4109 RepID=A0A9J5WAF6_SOLCO|nr:hypothetical protein H5410_062291 [Solanum commersonii]